MMPELIPESLDEYNDKMDELGLTPSILATHGAEDAADLYLEGGSWDERRKIKKLLTLTAEATNEARVFLEKHLEEGMYNEVRDICRFYPERLITFARILNSGGGRNKLKALIKAHEIYGLAPESFDTFAKIVIEVSRYGGAKGVEAYMELEMDLIAKNQGNNHSYSERLGVLYKDHRDDLDKLGILYMDFEGMSLDEIKDAMYKACYKEQAKEVDPYILSMIYLGKREDIAALVELQKRYGVEFKEVRKDVTNKLEGLKEAEDVKAICKYYPKRYLAISRVLKTNGMSALRALLKARDYYDIEPELFHKFAEVAEKKGAEAIEELLSDVSPARDYKADFDKLGLLYSDSSDVSFEEASIIMGRALDKKYTEELGLSNEIIRMIHNGGPENMAILLTLQQKYSKEFMDLYNFVLKNADEKQLVQINEICEEFPERYIAFGNLMKQKRLDSIDNLINARIVYDMYPDTFEEIAQNAEYKSELVKKTIPAILERKGFKTAFEQLGILYMDLSDMSIDEVSEAFQKSVQENGITGIDDKIANMIMSGESDQMLRLMLLQQLNLTEFYKAKEMLKEAIESHTRQKRSYWSHKLQPTAEEKEENKKLYARIEELCEKDIRSYESFRKMYYAGGYNTLKQAVAMQEDYDLSDEQVHSTIDIMAKAAQGNFIEYVDLLGNTFMEKSTESGKYKINVSNLNKVLKILSVIHEKNGLNSVNKLVRRASRRKLIMAEGSRLMPKDNSRQTENRGMDFEEFISEATKFISSDEMEEILAS